MPRKKHQQTDYEKARRKYREVSPRHVLVLEADMPEDGKRRAFGMADKLRICGNNVTARLQKSIRQFFRTKKYRTLQRDYGKASELLKNHPDSQTLKAERKSIVDQMAEMQKAYHVTWNDARKYMEYWKCATGANSIFALTRAEDIWTGAEKVLFGSGQKVHFRKRGDLPEIRAKQINRGIILSVKDGRLYFSYKGIGGDPFSYRPLDRFQQDEVNAILKYLEAPDENDFTAVSTLHTAGEIVDTFRPCFASLVCKEIRGKLRVYIHLTIEGRALPKYKSDGVTPRHSYGKGRVGADIGTETVGYTSQKEVGLKNLSERGKSITHSERQERRLLRKMDRSRRAMNPDNYNADGTIKKGRKKWKKSRHYIKTQKRHRELCRKNADSRHYAIREDAHHLRALGNVLITEPPNFKALQKKAKKQEEGTSSAPDTAKAVTAAIGNQTIPAANEQTQKESHKNKRRKRFGKSIQNRSPGAFQASLKEIFEGTGGSYREVDRMYRASQYDHTADEYIQKKLSQRAFTLTGGQKVQRDWYSSFLLYCSNEDYSAPDREKCIQYFEQMLGMQNELIQAIKNAGIHVMNSGIAV